MRHKFCPLLSWLILALLLSTCCQAGARDDLLVVVRDGKYGYIDHDGNVVIRPQFSWGDDFWRGLGSVYVCGRYASIDSSGGLHPLRTALEGQLEPHRKGLKAGFVDAAGQFKIPPKFDEVLPFSDGLAAVRLGPRWGFIGPSGAMVIQPKFEAAFYFREGVGLAESRSGYVLIDKSGKVLARGYEFLQGVTEEGRVPATRGGKAGYLDLRGRVIIPFVYDGADSFSEGLSPVKKGGKWGYVDRDGAVVIPLKFDYAGPFGNELAPAKLGGKTGFIDKSGNFAFMLAFDYAPGFQTGDRESRLLDAPSDVSRFWTTDGKFGYVKTSGKVIWGPTDGNPDHPPILGWSDKAKALSCENMSDEARKKLASFPGP